MIKYKDGVVLDDRQHTILDKINFFTEGYVLTVTRGHSLPEEQLAIIEKYAKQYDLIKKWPEFQSKNLKEKVIVSGKSVYRWQRVWSDLLNLFYISNEHLGAKVNPPMDAECLFNYVNGGVNKKGQIILASAHIKVIDDPRPCPIDFSGNLENYDGNKPPLAMVSDILLLARNSIEGTTKIKNITVELANNCVHIDLI